MKKISPSLQHLSTSLLDAAVRRVALYLLLVIAGLGIYWVLLLDSHHAKTNALAQQTHLRSAQLAKTISVQVETLFSSLDFLARNLVAEYPTRDTSGFDLVVATAMQAHPPGSILQVGVADREGNVVYSSLQSPPTGSGTTSIRDREHFQFHAKASDTGLYISHPVLGRLSKQWTIQLSRAIRVNGQFAGVMVVSVSPSYLSSFFHDIFNQPGDVILLLRDDGAYLARSQDEAAVLGTTMLPAQDFQLRRDQNQGNYEIVSRVDGVNRYYSWNRAGKLPLVVSVGIDRKAVGAQLQSEITKSLVFNGIGSAVLLLGALAIASLSLQRRQARKRAAESDRLLHKLVEQVPGALFQFMIRPDGSSCFTYFSQGIYGLLNITPEDTGKDGKAVLKSIEPDDALRVRMEIRAATVSLVPWESHFRVRALDGRTSWLHGRAKPERSSDGTVLWHGYLHDVTQERAVQEALRVSEEHLRLTLEAVHDGLWQYDLARRRIHLDARCSEMLGRPRTPLDLDYEALLEWIHPRDRERFEQGLAAHLHYGQPFLCEYRLRTMSGVWLWVESRGEVTDMVNDRPVQMRGTHTDISRRVAQTQLRRALLDESAAAILLATPERHISYANARAEAIFGTSDQSLVGQTVQVIHKNAASFKAFGEIYVQIRNWGSAQQEWEFTQNNGETHWFECRGSLLDPQDPDGEVIWTITDTDERHRAEAALRIAQQRLMAIVEHFPGGALVQEYEYGPVVAINQKQCELLNLPLAPGAYIAKPLELLFRELPLTIQSDIRRIDQQSSIARDLGTATEVPLTDGRALEVMRVPLVNGEQNLGLFWLMRDITARKQRESSMELLATTDPLTLLPNRRSFMERMAREFDLIRRGEHAAGIAVMLDIDFFKRVNDTWGHATGDQVLRHLADIMKSVLREGDASGRLGGEEFVILLAATGLDDGLAIAERLREQVATAPAPTDRGDIPFTVSLGISVLDGLDTDIDACLARADAAMYFSKGHGRNQVTIWQGGMDTAFPANARAPNSSTPSGTRNDRKPDNPDA